MATTFMTAEKMLLTSESVTEGHPDKLCDQISDAVLDAVYAQDPMGRVACEVAAKSGLVVIIGEITTHAIIDAQSIARDVIQEIRYNDSRVCLDYKTAGVIVGLQKQSPDIDMGVSKALEAKDGGRDPVDEIGAGDQGMMIGYACNETTEYMPLTISLAHKLTKRLAKVRKDGTLPYLGPDGKSQVTVEYHKGRPVRVDSIVVSTQHDDAATQKRIQADVMEHVIKPIVPAELLDGTRYYINPTGRFVIGGPQGDAGVTGRKIIVDTYGGAAPHGGGAFSGKDPTKVDRSASYMARYIAKNIVAAGLAERALVQLAYAIGVADPVSVMVETEGTGRVPETRLVDLVRAHFKLTPRGIMEDLDLRRPIYRQTAAFGHFGRSEPDFSWERIDRAELLRSDAGL